MWTWASQHDVDLQDLVVVINNSAKETNVSDHLKRVRGKVHLVYLGNYDSYNSSWFPKPDLDIADHISGRPSTTKCSKFQSIDLEDDNVDQKKPILIVDSDKVKLGVYSGPALYLVYVTNTGFIKTNLGNNTTIYGRDIELGTLQFGIDLNADSQTSGGQTYCPQVAQGYDGFSKSSVVWELC
ncbi:hypothetical protein FQN49_006958 [Arthroderma sp. PD_2]|nr:hypothetical protein FQN49_006958 [Arthroderma sp. PD_2]